MAEKHALIPDPFAPVATKDVKDISKNLMGADFERQYGSEKSDNRRQTWLVTVVVILSTLVVALLVLTMVREVHLGHLRHEVDELSASMIAMSATVKSLNQKIANNKHLFDEFKTSDDPIYADEDQELHTLSDDKDKDKTNDMSLEKLHDLTVLEDDLGDDEDLTDDGEVDDAESGDWYPDYVKRTENGAINNMDHLTPDDFSVPVLKFGKNVDMSDIREIKRLLNENPENPNIPALQPVAEAQTTRSKRSVFSDATPELVDAFAAPRVQTKDEERRKTKKYTAESAAKGLHTVTRIVRNSDNEYGGRPFIAAHFHGNTSHLSTEIHEHYKGNGLVRVSHGAAHDVWYPAPWTVASPHPRPTLTRNGHVHIHHTGVYLVYVQIYYLDSHDVISWVLHRTNADIEGRETLLQCAQSAHSIDRIDKPNSCFSAAALFLKAGDRLAVRNTGGDRHSVMQPEKSFIGLVKLADAEDPEQEF